MDKPGLALCDHVQRQGFHAHLFSDITVSFQGKDYKLHRIILSQSAYFRSLLLGPWKESGKPRVELKIDDHNVTVEGLEVALAYLYGVVPAFTNDNVVGVLGAGCFLCVENLCEQCVQFMVADIREETFLGYQQLAERHCYGHYVEGLRDACWSYLCLHAARELVQVLPKLSLPVLCRLLKSDELWVTTESERYTLAKQVLLEWKLLRTRTSNAEGGSSKRQRAAKSNLARKAAKTASGKSKDKGSKTSTKDKSKKKGEASNDEKPASSRQKEDVAAESPLRKLRSLWEEDAEEAADKEGFDMVVDVFCSGGIIFAYMNATEALQVRKELEDASMPTDVINDAIWQNVLLKSRMVREVKEEVEEEEEEEEESSDSDSDTSVSDHESSDSASSVYEDELHLDASTSSAESLKSDRMSLVPYSSAEQKPFDGKRRKSTGGFSWSAQLHGGMLVSDFPPFRFGTEFKDGVTGWYSTGYAKDVFFGGSRWYVSMIGAGKEAWTVALKCNSARYPGERHVYSDRRKVVRYSANLYMATSSGLQCVTGTGKRNCECGVEVTLKSKDLPPKGQLFRVVAVVQLIENESKTKTIEQEA